MTFLVHRFQLRNGLSAKVHGYKHNGKLVLEGLFSIFTEDGKPVNIIYKTDENNYRDSEPTIFHLDIPSFDQINLDDENDDLNPVPMYMPFQSNSSKILTIDQSADDDGQFSDLILEPTTQQPDDEDSYTTEISIEWFQSIKNIFLVSRMYFYLYFEKYLIIIRVPSST